MYVFYIPILQSSYDGGGQWLETISSSPFTWYAGGTNDADGSSNNIAFHKAGHADNVEVSRRRGLL